MAEGVLFNVAADILLKLTSLVLGEAKLVWGVHDEIENLKSTISSVRAVLLDAEEKQFTSHEVKDWLMKLQEILYDVDDLLDGVTWENLWREAMTRDRRSKKVRIFFSSSNHLLCGFKIGQRIKSIRKRLYVVAKDRRQFHFNECFIEKSLVRKERIPTDSFIREEDVVGREHDKKVIMEFLMNFNMEENVSVISIYGIGGLGKTTIAQAIYNDKEVKEYFQIKQWVCVSNEFDVTSIAKGILGSSNNNIDSQVKQKVAQKLDGKRYLIVLDDVWNEERAKWLDLRSLLNRGARGSKILVTTRAKRVAETCGDAVEPYLIKGLNNEESWFLFCKIAFAGGKEPRDKNLVQIGKEIVEKCKGVPLAIRSLGSLLYHTSPARWSTFRDKELSRIYQLKNDIMPILKLSYDHLPSSLKHCFAYCAIFPQDYVFKIEILVSHWIAQGFIQPSGTTLEDDGYQCCEELIARSFFQVVITDAEGTFRGCKLHDLMHDLAWSVSVMKCCEEDRKRIHHLRGSSWPESSEPKDIRSFILHKPSVSFQIDLHSVCKAHSLRVLELSGANIRELPDCIADMKHLRYLNLGKNRMRELPHSISRLQHLHTLILDECMSLESLPRGITKLINLTHLSVKQCLALSCMPRGMGHLTSLQILPKFIVCEEQSREGCKLSELNRLNKLKGSLKLDCKRVESLSFSEAKAANLEGKQYLSSLELSSVKNNAMLEALQPQSHLKELQVFAFQGDKIPNWLSTLKNLVFVDLILCNRCRHLPPMHQLPVLESLFIRRCEVLEYIADSEELASSTIGTTLFFPSLQTLWFEDLPRLTGWWNTKGIDENVDGSPSLDFSLQSPHLQHFEFQCLSYLSIVDCPNLEHIPHCPTIDVDFLVNVKETLRHKILKPPGPASSSAETSIAVSSGIGLNTTISNL